MKTVMIFGTFDGVHEGHRFLFRQAKKYGKRLVAVVARDETVVHVKGREPKYPECMRYAALFGEEEIDEVVLGDVHDRLAAVKQWQPDVICLGYDQSRFVDGLQKNFSGKIIRLASFQPEIFKSSKMVKDEHFVVRAKAAMRKRFLQKRKMFSGELQRSESEKVAEKIFNLPEIRSARTIALYRSGKNELDTHSLFRRFWEEGKTTLIPLSCDQIECAVVTEQAQYTRGAHGIDVPSDGTAFTGCIDAAIVPCVAFDTAGNRLGSGSGWYDRFLAEHPETISIGVGFSVQCATCVPAEKHDQKMWKRIAP